MNEHVRNSLYHAWGKSPEDKRQEHDYNVGYYQKHREKIIRNVLERKRKNKNMSTIGFDIIIQSIDKEYEERVKRAKSTNTPSLYRFDLRSSGEKAYDAIHAMIDVGRKFIKLIRKPFDRTDKSLKVGRDWLKKHW